MTPQDAANTILFYVLGAAAVLLALALVNTRRLLRAAIYLMGVLAASAGLYILLGAEFLAGIQVLVYVGGIVVLIVFAVMLTRSADLLVDKPTLGRMILGGATSIAFLILSATTLWFSDFGVIQDGAAPKDNTLAIGKQLLDTGAGGYVLPFEIISLLLLGAIIAGIVIARKAPPRNQPLTSGGDLPGEVTARLPRSQKDKAVEGGRS
jgi:NADH-quinone oxidoreductase subunit J